MRGGVISCIFGRGWERKGGMREGRRDERGTEMSLEGLYGKGDGMDGWREGGRRVWGKWGRCVGCLSLPMLPLPLLGGAGGHLAAAGEVLAELDEV